MKSTPMNQQLYKYSTFERKKNRNIQFQYLRKTKEIQSADLTFNHLDYLSNYSQSIQQQIKDSLTGPIPHPLPPLSLSTISYYRRSLQPIYQVTPLQSTTLDHHMVCQSLYLLAKIDKDQYPNYTGLVMKFQREFKSYLSMNSKWIYDMAVISAGNKVIGTEKDILQLVKMDAEQVWVLINHCYSGKITYKYLEPFLLVGNHNVFKMFYAFSNEKGHQSIYYLMDSESRIQSIFHALNSNNQEIKLYAIRILGNICGQSSTQEAVNADITYNISILLKYNILDQLFPIIMTNNLQIKKDVYWLISNLACHQQAATAILRKSKIIEKLMELLYYELKLDLKKSLIKVFYMLGDFGEKRLVFELFVNKNFLEVLGECLAIEDNEIVQHVLELIKRLIELGLQYLDENDQNIVILMLSSRPQFTKALQKYQQSQNHNISSACQQIIGHFSTRGQRMQQL